MTIAQNEMKESACNLHLTLLRAGERCPACGWNAEDHPNHPINRTPTKSGNDLRRAAIEARDRERDRERLLGCVAAFIKAEAYWDWSATGIRVPRAVADALDGTVEIRLTETDYILTFKPKP